MDHTMGDSRTAPRPAVPDPMRLLAAGIPLSLLLDLVGLDEEGSQDLARVERADTSWVTSAA